MRVASDQEINSTRQGSGVRISQLNWNPSTMEQFLAHDAVILQKDTTDACA